MTYLSMYDSAAPCEIPTTAQLVAPYVDGLYQWSPEQMARFGGARRLLLSVEGDPDASAYDREQGCCTIDELVTALRSRRKRGLASMVYCALDQWQPTLDQLTVAGLADPPTHWWVAHVSQGAGGPVPPAPKVLPELGRRYRALAQQYYWGPSTGPGCYDVSAVDPAALHVLGLYR